MEYIRGRSGAEILREETRLGVADTLELVDGACRGLAHAHRMGVIHRDVKPGNILRSDDGAVKLADFGIAKAMVGGTSQITQAGSVLGTAAYLAPEQASRRRGRPAGGPLRPRRRDLPAARRAPALRRRARSPSSRCMQQREYPVRLDELAPEVPRGARARRRARARARARASATRAPRRCAARCTTARAGSRPRARDGDRRDVAAAARRADRRDARRPAPAPPAAAGAARPPPPLYDDAGPTRRCARAATTRRRAAAAPGAIVALHRRSPRLVARRDRVRASAAPGRLEQVQISPVDGDSVERDRRPDERR